MNSNIYAVIVTYNPELKNLNALITELKEQNCYVVVVDNSTNFTLKDKLADIEKVHLICLGRNEGIAKAQNIGIRYSLEKRAEKIIFFDQDSRIRNEFIKKLSCYMDNENAKIAGPVFIDRDKSHYYPICNIKKNGLREKIHVTEGQTPFKSSVTISSGTMVSKEVFEIVGMMDEELFIDYVDTEWCLRCLNYGILVHIIPDIEMVHAIGDKSVKICGINIPIHSPVRRYYRVRNAFLLLRKNHVPLLLSIREVVFSLIHTTLIIATQKNKIEYMKKYILATLDGIRGITGGGRYNA
ncbi:TPA: rhamnosyltransferase [Escherichia coli]|uniref:rhamnosyltransferase n=1 Tax=Escherichia TaxID=561 RepID=UPI0002F108A2|nr:rhamnosyltransferase family protein [Escherichia coli 1-176-05_S3_C2]WGM52683.1 rhamnosyltransferase [Escherichia ruysiae]HAL9677280.1 rhamnosyltransferase [Escherichia coli]HAV7812564.1 rhamnosyltransferase [Escherichia coli]HAW5066262.1 rhamnosyltransferase [Escherichia coli]